MKNPTAKAYFAAVKFDLKMFIQHAFPTVYEGKELLTNWHLEAMIHALEQCRKGARPRLIFNLPPRHLKSFMISVAWPAFLLGHDPSLKIFCVSYSDELAKALAREFKRIVESDWYRAIFPNVRWTKQTETEQATHNGGFRYAVSVGGTLTGRGADLIIIDDPAKPAEAQSETGRNRLNDWYRSTLLSRLDDKKRGGIVLVMQRLHVNDLTGFAEAGGGFRKLAFPAIATRDEVIPLRNGESYQRLIGEPLQADRDDLDVLESIRDDIGEFLFNAQYQQSPETPEGNLFKRKWFRTVDSMPDLGTSPSIAISIDSALSTSETADFSAITVVARVKGNYYVLSAERGRWEYEELKKRALHYLQRYRLLDRNPTFVVERAGSGVSLLQFLNDVRMKEGRIRVFHTSPKSDKLTRAAFALPDFAEGRVVLVDIEGNTWVEPFVNEFLSFPHGRHDDQVDSLVQVINYRLRVFGHNGMQ